MNHTRVCPVASMYLQSSHLQMEHWSLEFFRVNETQDRILFSVSPTVKQGVLGVVVNFTKPHKPCCRFSLLASFQLGRKMGSSE